MPNINLGIFEKLTHKIILNMNFIVVFIIILFVINILFHKQEEVKEESVLLDKSFEDIDEIYIGNEFGKSYILKPPKRSRIIVQKKELEKSNNYVIKITIIQ